MREFAKHLLNAFLPRSQKSPCPSISSCVEVAALFPASHSHVYYVTFRQGIQYESDHTIAAMIISSLIDMKDRWRLKLVLWRKFRINCVIVRHRWNSRKMLSYEMNFTIYELWWRRMCINVSNSKKNGDMRKKELMIVVANKRLPLW